MKFIEKIKTNSVKVNKYVFCYSFVAIALIHFIVFYICVNINSILMAFKEYQGLDENYNEIYAISFGNFGRIFTEFSLPDSSLYIGLINTFKYFGVNIFIVLPLTVLVAYFLYKKIYCFKFLRAVFFLPSIISGVVYISIFKSIISQYGPLYTVIEKLFGYKMPSLLNNEATATPTIIFYTVWTGIGVNMILYHGAMMRIPQSVIEVGQLEGVSRTRELFCIVLPMIWPTLSITIILAFTGIFTSSGPILLFSDSTSALGANNTMTLPFYIYYLTWSARQYEYPAAIGVFFTVLGLPVVYIIRTVMSKLDPEVEY